MEEGITLAATTFDPIMSTITNNTGLILTAVVGVAVLGFAIKLVKRAIK